MRKQKITSLFTISAIAVLLQSCGGNYRADYTDLSGNYRGHYKIGNPYQIEGEWYYPEENPDYNVVGMASWYGPNFHGKATANGDLFNQNALTAAHKTLPLPSMVRVTNLENSRTVVLMVNDRGPYAKGRIIDVSKAAAKVLEFHDEGLTRVRVEFLPGHTKKLLADLKIDGQMPYETARNLERSIQKKNNGNLSPDVAAPIVVAAANTMPPKKLHVPNSMFLNQAHAAAPVQTKTPPPPPFPAKTTMEDPTVAAAAPLPTKRLYIQAGAFGVKENADRLGKRLLAFGHTSIVPLQARNTTLYRVRIGPIKDKESANMLLAQLQDSGHNDVRVVSE